MPLTRTASAKTAAVEKQAVYPHPPDKVWRALTDEKSLSKWLLPVDKSVVPKRGHRFAFSAPTGPVHCEVVEAEPERRLAYTWQAAPDTAPSLVIWTLTPTEDGNGTHVRLSHDAALPGGSLLKLSACLRGGAASLRRRGLWPFIQPMIFCPSRSLKGELICR